MSLPSVRMRADISLWKTVEIHPPRRPNCEITINKMRLRKQDIKKRCILLPKGQARKTIPAIGEIGY